MQFHRKPHTFVNHVHLYVEDLNRSVQFYEEILGFKTLERTDRKADLTADGKTALLSVEQPVGVAPKEPRRSGLYHMAILLPTRADLGKFLQHLLLNGIRPGSSDHLVSEALYFNDPDGNGIEVYRDREPEEWAWNGNMVAMATEYLDAQGVLEAGGGQPWTGLPADTLMGHIHLHVGDAEKATEFYTKGLGFDVVSHYPNAAFLSTGKYHHHIAVNTWQGEGAPPKSENSVGLHSYTLVYPDQPSLQQAMESVRSLGYEVKSDGNVYITEDPSKNRIILSL